MKEKFPFSAPELVVTKDMCDINGHMNVAYYLKIFDECSRPLFEDMGFNDESSFSIFALEDSLRYLKEFLSDPRVIEVPKLIWQTILRLVILNLEFNHRAIKNIT